MNVAVRLILILFCITGFNCSGKNRGPGIVLSGPPVDASFPLICMAEKGQLSEYGGAEFVPWENPDQLRALVSGKQVDIAVIATSVSGNLHNRGIPIKQLTISLPGSGKIISAFKMKSVADLKGRKIVMPYRGDMPGIVFTSIMEKNGLLPSRDFEIIYCASSIDALQFLFSGRADSAFVSDTAAAVAADRFLCESDKGNLKAYRELALHKLWEKTFGRKTLPVSGLSCVGARIKDTAFCESVIKEYEKARRWCKENPHRAAVIAAKYFPSLKEEAIERQISRSSLEFKRSSELKDDLNFLYKVLMKKNTSIIAGKIPGDDFY